MWSQAVVISLLNVIFYSAFGYSKAEQDELSDKAILGKRKGLPGQEYDPETDEMFGDAVPVPTPAVCSEGTTCGFLVYDDPTTGYHNHTYTHYCNCPDGLKCAREGTNMELRYFYFRCTNETNTEQPGTESSMANSSVLAENASERSSTAVPSSSVRPEASPSSQDNTQNAKRIGYVNEEL